MTLAVTAAGSHSAADKVSIGAPLRLSGDAAALQAVTRLAAEIAPTAAERDRARRLPRAEIEAVTQAGLFALTVPRTLGGAGVSVPALVEVFASLAAADTSIAQIPQSHYALLEALRLAGAAEQQVRLFGLVRDGARIANALAERGTATARAIATRLTGDGAGFRLNGRKFYSTGALFAHWLGVVALNDAGQRVIAFVPADSPGVTLTDDWSGFGQRTTASGSTVLQDVPVAAENVVRQHKVFDAPTRMGPFAQVLHAAIDVGAARAAFAATVEVVRTRARPWADSGLSHATDDPYTIGAVGEVRVRLAAAEALLQRAANTVEDVPDAPSAEQVAAASLAVAEAKVAATEAALLAGSKLIELGGSSATLTELNLDRHWRDARTHTVHDPVRWKLHALGRNSLSGILPPRSGTL
jgi:SfnB family sulfur acquisition oxidoreductase